MMNNLTNNFNEIKEKSLSNLNTLQKLITDNKVTLADAFTITQKLNNVVTKIERRVKQHEDFMTTSVAVCAEPSY